MFVSRHFSVEQTKMEWNELVEETIWLICMLFIPALTICSLIIKHSCFLWTYNTTPSIFRVIYGFRAKHCDYPRQLAFYISIDPMKQLRQLTILNCTASVFVGQVYRRFYSSRIVYVRSQCSWTFIQYK